jgi:hypothetical protein
VGNRSGPNHIQIDVNQAMCQMAICTDGRCKIPVFPECTLSAFSLVVLLRRATGHELQCGSYGRAFIRRDQKMNMIAGCNVVQNRYSMSLPGLKQPVLPAATVPFEPEQKFSIMAAMSDMPDRAWNKKSIGPWHGNKPPMILKASFSSQKELFNDGKTHLRNVRNPFFQQLALVRPRRRNGIQALSLTGIRIRVKRRRRQISRFQEPRP